MGRHKKAENVDIKPWLSGKRNCTEGRFQQVGNSFFLSPEVHVLKDSTKWLYLCMANEAGGKPAFVFPLSAALKYGISETTFRRCIKELIDKHFIVLTSSGKKKKKKNFYSFISDWKPP